MKLNSTIIVLVGIGLAILVVAYVLNAESVGQRYTGLVSFTLFPLAMVLLLAACTSLPTYEETKDTRSGPNDRPANGAD